MKNKFFKIVTVLLINIFFITNSYSLDQFSFDVTKIEILENGNIFKGSDKGIIKTNDGIIIKADSFEYNKISNILTAKGNVEIEDTLQNYNIFLTILFMKKIKK